jgi:DNA-binding Xre family transcriptional regulator
METTANQIILDFVLVKRRLGKSTRAQKVGIIGMSTITISTIKFNGLKAICQLPAIRLDAGLSCFQPGSRLPVSYFFM